MLENEERIGNFTSSQIHKLMKVKKDGSFAQGALTYIEEKKIERRMGRALQVEAHAKAMAWGQFIETHVHGILGMEYLYVCKGTATHPTIKGWSGSTDFIVPDTSIADLKGFEPKHFATYTDAILTKDTEVLKRDHPEEYWQLVSSAIINKVDYAEAITFMPYRKDLEMLREKARNYDCPESELWKYRFIAEGSDMSLAHLPNKGYYKDLNKFMFEVPKVDIISLTAQVMKGIKLLNKK